jgi:predicted Co/Zn/Cd cation transporter (cation efflux family)
MFEKKRKTWLSRKNCLRPFNLEHATFKYYIFGISGVYGNLWHSWIFCAVHALGDVLSGGRLVELDLGIIVCK